MSRRTVGLLTAVLVVLAGGCATGTDDEMAPPPTRTITATPSQSVAPAPATIPVGHGDVSPDDIVWAQDSTLHVDGDMREFFVYAQGATKVFAVLRG